MTSIPSIVVPTSPVDHDLAPGPVTRCQVCGSDELVLVLDLGHQPLCDSMRTTAQLAEPETRWPLRLMRCPRCTLTQLDHVVPGDVVYHPGYPYRSGITRELADYQRTFCDGIVGTVGLAPGSLCVDIGSNDGTLLTGFAANGMRPLGIEPTDIAHIAREENGIETIQAFFTESLARDIRAEHGPADVITATNVFAHMGPLGEVMRGIGALLADDGAFISESHYLLDVVNKTQYDTIYHEHIRTYSLRSLVTLFAQYDMDVFDVERASRYGGNIRVFVARRGTRPVADAVADLLAVEHHAGLHLEDTYESFRTRVFRSRNRLMTEAFGAAERGDRFVGNSCPGRCVTLLNFCGMTPDLMPYVAEQPTSLKLGLHVPGLGIPVVDNQILIDEQPDTVVLLAWHYAEPIAAQLRARGLRSRLLVPLPTVEDLPLPAPTSTAGS